VLNRARALRRRLTGTIGARVLSAFGLTVVLALLAALVSLSAVKDATERLENLQDTQRQMISAVKDLELGVELQSDSVQAYLLSGDERYLQDQARGQARFAEAFDTLGALTAADEGLDRLDDVQQARTRFESSAASQLALYRQGWQRSATFLWRSEGQDAKQQLDQQINAYRAWYETAVQADVSAARERGHLALVLSIALIVAAALAGEVVGIQLTRSITGRLGKLAAAAQAIARDDFSARAVVGGVDEVAALAGAMNRMAEHLDESRRALEASRQELRESLDRERRRAEQLQQAARVGRKMSRLANLDELLPNVANLLHELFGYERVGIFLIDEASGLASLRAAAGVHAAPIPKFHTVPKNHGIIGWVAANDRTLHVPDVRTDPRYVEGVATAGTRSELAVPIRTGGQLLGVLDIESTRVNAFDANDEATITILARQIATVIQNARLFEQQHNLAVAEERNRLAREIHDTLAQGLTAITLQLEVADALLEVGPEQARPKIAKALELTRANLEEARRSVMDLRAAPLQERTLPAALRELVAGFGRDHGLRADFGTRDAGDRLPAPLEAGLYRIAQEALNNVAKHATANAVRVTLERNDGSLMLAVEDDGSGFDPQAPAPDRLPGGFGLIGMQERARLLGGRLDVDSAPTVGTRIVVTVPAPARSPATEPNEAAPSAAREVGV
jgi:two-component system NarL family sensor kinase